MLAYQVNQVGQMYAVSGNLMQAFVVQLPDVLAIAGGLTGALAGGAIAIGASLIPALLSGGGAAEGFGNKIADANSALDAMDTLSATSADAINTYLTAAFHGSAGAVGELLDKLKQLQFEAITKQTRELVGGTVQELDRVLASWQEAEKSIGANTSARVKERLADLTRRAEQVKTLRDALSSVGESKSVDELTVRLGDAYKIAQNMGGEIGQSVTKSIEDAAAKGDILDRVMHAAAAATKGMAGDAGSVADELARAADQAARLAQNKFDTQSFLFSNRFQGEETVMGQSLTPHVLSQAQIDAALGHKKTGQGAGVARHSIDELIASLKSEGETIRANDPVQQEMLRYRRQLATATDTQREAVKQLITQNIAEQQHMEQLRQTTEFFGQTGYDAISGMILQGKSLSEVMSNVASAIAEAALQAALLGTGPLAGVLGGSGGLLGSLAQAIIPGHAAGGFLTGPGTGTSDSMVIRASSGEFMVNARATSQHRPLLEAINDGLPAFAGGGLVGGSRPPAGFQAAMKPQDVHIHIDLAGAKGNSEVYQTAMQAVHDGLTVFSRDVLPFRVQQISSDPRKRG